MLKNTLFIIALLLMTSACETNKLALQDKMTPEKETTVTKKGEKLTGNPYKVERTFPPYVAEHRKLFTEKSGIYQAGNHPVWTVHSPDQWAGNITFIETKNDLIVVDCSIGTQASVYALQEIRKITQKPITTIIYTHHHTDHYNGTEGLVSKADVQSGKVKIYAWENFVAEKEEEFGTIMNRQTMGSLYFSGAALDKEDRAYLACCGTKVFGGKAGYIPPTHLIDSDGPLTIDGLVLDLFYTGGEAVTEFGIYIPEFDMVLIADEFFYSFPNLHSIRSSKPRSPKKYIETLDKVRKLRPEWLVGSHIMPIQGKDHIEEIITVSRDAIQYVWDQSIRYINKGYTTVELQHKLQKLPEYLDLKPYTATMYGSPITSVPEFYTGWVSWFQGDATDLFPDHPIEEAKKMIELIGGRDKVLAAAEKAFGAGDANFGAKLTQYLVRVDHEDMRARYLKAACLKKIGYTHTNQIMRSWYLTGAKELEGTINPKAILQRSKKRLMGGELTPRVVFNNWRYLIDAEKAGQTPLAIQLNFTDISESWTLVLRNSILEITQNSQQKTATILNTTVAQLNAFSKGGNITDSFSVEKGSLVELEKLDGFLDKEVPAIYMHMR